MSCRNLQKNHKHIDLVVTRRLQPVGIHERNDNVPVKAKSIQATCNNKQVHSNPENVFKSKNRQFNLGEDNISAFQSYRLGNDEASEQEEQEFNNDSSAPYSKKASSSKAQLEKNRQPFDPAPFYKQVKPHITTQKRVRYVHLLEPSNSKIMPKETMGEPIIYDKKVEEGELDDEKIGIKNHSAKKRAPLSLNPIFHQTGNVEHNV